jgi:hypothetical protein
MRHGRQAASAAVGSDVRCLWCTVGKLLIQILSKLLLREKQNREGAYWQPRAHRSDAPQHFHSGSTPAEYPITLFGQNAVHSVGLAHAPRLPE